MTILYGTTNNTLSKAIDVHAPLKTKNMMSRLAVPWYNDDIKIAKRVRRKAERKWRRTKLGKYFVKYFVGKYFVGKIDGIRSDIDAMDVALDQCSRNAVPNDLEVDDIQTLSDFQLLTEDDVNSLIQKVS